jgi:hypothetical protein
MQLFAEYFVTASLVKPNVVLKTLVRIEAHLAVAQRAGERFCVVEELPTESPPLEFWRDGDVLDQQVVRFADRFDQCRQVISEVQKIDAVVPHGCRVVRRHRFGLATDDRHPFGVSSPR